MGHDPERASDNQRNNQHAEGKRLEPVSSRVHSVMVWDGESLIFSEGSASSPVRSAWLVPAVDAALMTVKAFGRPYSESSLQTSKIRTPSIGSGSRITSGSASVRRALS